LSQLNETQRRALELVAQGTTTSKEISRLLDRSPGTIDTYLSQAAIILGVSTRQEAARIYNELRNSDSELRPEPLASDPDPALSEPADRLPEGRLQRWLRALFPPIGGPDDGLTASKALWLVIQLTLMGAVASAIVVTIYFWVMGQFAGLSR
jgi:DNA-binding CsgD family transcriptional regulator